MRMIIRFAVALSISIASAHAQSLSDAQRIAVQDFQSKFPTNPLGKNLQVIGQRSRHVTISDGIRLVMLSKQEPLMVLGWTDSDLRKEAQQNSNTSLFQTEAQWWAWIENRIRFPSSAQFERSEIKVSATQVALGFHPTANGYPAPGITPYWILLRRHDGKLIEYFAPSWECRFEPPAQLLSPSNAVQAAVNKLGWRSNNVRVIGDLRYVEASRFGDIDEFDATLAYCIQGPSGQVDVRARDGAVSLGAPQLPTAAQSPPTVKSTSGTIHPSKGSRQVPSATQGTQSENRAGLTVVLACVVVVAGVGVGWRIARGTR